MTADFNTLLKAAKLPEKAIQVCLRGDLTAEFERLERQLEEARRRPADSLGGDGTGAIVERMDDLRQQMLDNSYEFRLRAMPRPAWRAFIGEHPPRQTDDGEVDERDKFIGVNLETFHPALIRRCLVDPQLDERQWHELEQVLTDRQFDTLADAAWSLNRRDVDIPFSRAASQASRNTETG